MRRSRQTPKKILGIPTHFGMMMPTLDNTTTGENSTFRLDFPLSRELPPPPHEYYSSNVSHVCDMLTENRLISDKLIVRAKKDDSMSNSVLTCQLFNLLAHLLFSPSTRQLFASYQLVKQKNNSYCYDNIPTPHNGRRGSGQAVYRPLGLFHSLNCPSSPDSCFALPPLFSASLSPDRPDANSRSKLLYTECLHGKIYVRQC